MKLVVWFLLSGALLVLLDRWQHLHQSHPTIGAIIIVTLLASLILARIAIRWLYSK